MILWSAIIIAFFWGVLPFVLGSLPELAGAVFSKNISAAALKHRIEEGNGIISVYITGVFFEMGLFQIAGVPFVLAGRKMNELSIAASGVYTITITIVMTLAFRMGRKCPGFWKDFVSGVTPMKRKTGVMILWAAVAVLLAFQVCKVITYAFYDGDDAYYLVQAVEAYTQGGLYRTVPYTGFATELDMRHATAVYPLYLAYISSLARLHPAIVAHTAMPVFMLLLLYGILYITAREIKKITNATNEYFIPLFMLFSATAVIFGGVSIYSSSTFIIQRASQGKAAMAGPALLLLWYFIIRTARIGTMEFRDMFMMLSLCTAAALFTSMGCLLILFTIGIAGVIISIVRRDPGLLVKYGISCIPCFVYSGLYYVCVLLS